MPWEEHFPWHLLPMGGFCFSIEHIDVSEDANSIGTSCIVVPEATVAQWDTKLVSDLALANGLVSSSHSEIVP